MATTFFPRNAAPVTDVTLSSQAGSSYTGTHKGLSLTRGAAAATQTDNTIAGSGAGSEIAGWGGTSFLNGLLFISEPLDAVNISGTITANLRASESNAMANYGVAIHIFAIDATGQVQDSSGAVSFSNQGTELGTSEAARSWNPTIFSSPIVVPSGGRLLVILEWGETGGTSASGFTASGFYDGLSGATGDTFVTFTEAITVQSAATFIPYRNPYPSLLVQ